MEGESPEKGIAPSDSYTTIEFREQCTEYSYSVLPRVGTTLSAGSDQAALTLHVSDQTASTATISSQTYG